MKRPSKKKNNNSNSPESTSADDRHLIDAEESVELSIEDKISLYWMENKLFIIGCFSVMVIILVGLNGMKMNAANQMAKLQDAYTTAVTDGTLEDFARTYSETALGGFAALTQADLAYTEGNYTEAADLYALSLAGLENNILAGRARLGQAFANYQGDSQEQGIALLNAIHSDTNLPAAILAEAAYNLAVHAYAAGDNATFESFASRVSTLDESGQWKRRIETYKQFAASDDAER
jgi:predicted negative regulator of RcsB-dependent stress response